MKINLKDYNLKKIIKIQDNTAIYEEFTDNLSKSWNELSKHHFIEDRYKDLKLNVSSCKVEIDTLLSTYDLINKEVIRVQNIKKETKQKTNLNILTPCINLLNKGIQIIENKNIKDKEIDTKEYLIKIQFKHFVYQEYRQLDINFKEQDLISDDFKFTILSKDKYTGYDYFYTEDWQEKYLKKLFDFVIYNNISLSNNIEYFILYLSRMYILNLDKSFTCCYFGKILKDGYGEIVFLTDGNIVYKIRRFPSSFNVYKNEKIIL